MKPRTLDTALVLDGWPALAPADDDAFADRVLAALDAPVPARARRWPLYACALAVAGLLAPLLVIPRGTPPSRPTVVAHGPDLDLGLQTD